MEDPSSPKTDYDKPVAYDANGRPLYSHPDNEAFNKTEDDIKTIDVSAKTSHEIRQISDSDKLKHDRSVKLFPNLGLKEGDYVVSLVRRHPIGLFVPFSLGFILVSMAFFVLFNHDLIINLFQSIGFMTNALSMSLPAIIFIMLVLAGEYVVYYVYTSNRLFLTNDSIIQEIQLGLFSKSEHIVSLDRVEDASYSQNGILQQLLNYGSIRLSTVGDETTYGLTFVSNPKESITLINNSIENFKINKNNDC